MNFQPIQISKEIRSRCRLNRHLNGTIYINYVLWEQKDPVKKYARSIRKSIGKVLAWPKGLS